MKQDLLLVGSFYDGAKHRAVLKFYSPLENKIVFWTDTTGHRPYCYSKDGPATLSENLDEFDPRVAGMEVVRKFDLLEDKEIGVTKIFGSDPLSIGGAEGIANAIRAHEADIKYHETYLYDNGLVIGTYYRLSADNSLPVPIEFPITDDMKKVLDSLFTGGKNSKFADAIRNWASLLNQPLPSIKRAGVDIEVLTEGNMLPNAEEARMPVIGASLVGSDGLKRVYILLRAHHDWGDNTLPPDVVIRTFFEEKQLLLQLFKDMLEYPCALTFNGDDFDFTYLYHRALNLKIPYDEIPIKLGHKYVSLKHGLHIDLYKTFSNRSLQIYAFGNKYQEKSLEAISEGLLGESKLKYEGDLNDLDLFTMAKYNERDAELTLRLSSFQDEILMKLLILIGRICKLPIEDLSRTGASGWNRSMIYFECRRHNYLIPSRAELQARGTKAKSVALIKGKKYKGGFVLDPSRGVHFGVSVLDFASLYPSIIKVYNISFETINCLHDECRANKIPEVDSWHCGKRVGIESLVIGSLRDLRVEYYKHLIDTAPDKATKAFLKTVSQSLKVIMNSCFSPDTDVMTTQGIKNIKELKIGDNVINVNPETMQTEIDEIIETQEFDYEGEMIHFQNLNQVDLLVTPDHKMLVKRHDWTQAKLVSAQEVIEKSDLIIPKRNMVFYGDDYWISLIPYMDNDCLFIIYSPELPLSPKGNPKHMDAVNPEAWKILQSAGAKYHKNNHKRFSSRNLTEAQIVRLEELNFKVYISNSFNNKVNSTAIFPWRVRAFQMSALLGWVISEGCVGFHLPKKYANGNQRGFSYHLDITQSKGRGNPRGDLYKKEIESLLHDMGIVNTYHNSTFRICGKVFYNFVSSTCYTTDKMDRLPSYYKRVPDFILQSNKTVQKHLFDSLNKGDGSFNRLRYTTVSKSLAENYLQLATSLGYHGYIQVDESSSTCGGFYSEPHASSCYRIYLFNTTLNLNQHEGKKFYSKEQYCGKVYCVTTKKNHTVFAGRNGTFVPVGQCYGTLGFEEFNLYFLPAAEAITALGRYSIQQSIAKAKSLDVKVVYSDTDSCFIESASPTQLEELRGWVSTTLGVDMDVDKQYRYVCFSNRKKNYFGVLVDGSMDIKGLTGKKSNTPIFIRSDFKKTIEILKKVQTPADFAAAKDQIMTLLRATVQDLEADRLPMDGLAFHVMLNKDLTSYAKDPQHVKAAQQLMLRTGKVAKAGEVIEFVKTTSEDGVAPLALATRDEVDKAKYLEQMESTFDQILSTMGSDFKEVQGQTKMESWFG